MATKKAKAKAAPSKKKRPTSRTSEAKQTAKTKSVSRVIAKPAFLALVKSLKVYASDMDDARSTIANAIGTAVKTKHLHKRAFAIFRSLDKLPQPKRDEAIRQLMMMGSHAGWDSQKDLFDNIQYVDPKKNIEPELPLKKDTKAGDKPDATKTDIDRSGGNGRKPFVAPVNGNGKPADPPAPKEGQAADPPAPPPADKTTAPGSEAKH